MTNCTLCDGTFSDEAPHAVFKCKPFCISCAISIIEQIINLQDRKTNYPNSFCIGTKGNE